MEYIVPIKTDNEGLTGRECPSCEKYFKIKFGTGLPDAEDCHCPYCNHIGPQTKFWTKQQIEYAQSVALNEISKQLLSQMKKLEKKPDQKAFISIGITVKGQPTPIAYYSESDLEQRVVCSNCTLEYSIFGNFGYCPDCGAHNSLQILSANFELILKILTLAKTSTNEIASKLIENCLEDAISSFDGFGREHCSVLQQKLSFQNISTAKDKLLSEIGINISSGLSETQWDFIHVQFQKRHLLAHKMGVIDEEYVQKTKSPTGLIGRKIVITEEDVRLLIDKLKLIAGSIYKNIIRK